MKLISFAFFIIGEEELYFLIIRKGAVNFALVKFTNLQMPEQTRYKCRNKLIESLYAKQKTEIFNHEIFLLI